MRPNLFSNSTVNSLREPISDRLSKVDVITMARTQEFSFPLDGCFSEFYLRSVRTRYLIQVVCFEGCSFLNIFLDIGYLSSCCESVLIRMQVQVFHYLTSTKL